MTIAFITHAAEYVKTEEGQAVLQQLASHGLGIFVPHMHDEVGAFAELPQGIVQLEKELKVSFVNATDPCLPDSVEIGWRWDPQSQVVMRCVRCFLKHHT